MKIIAIAAVSGGGKTTISQALLKKLPSSKALYFDDYEIEGSPDDFIDWVNNGSDYNVWNVTPIIEDIEVIKRENIQYLILDYPFSYLNEQMKSYINISIFVDTPLDVAMARRLIRDFQDKPSEIIEDVSCYLNGARLGYLTMLEKVKPNADFIINGNLNMREIVDRITDIIITAV